MSRTTTAKPTAKKPTAAEIKAAKAKAARAAKSAASKAAAAALSLEKEVVEDPLDQINKELLELSIEERNLIRAAVQKDLLTSNITLEAGKGLGEVVIELAKLGYVYTDKLSITIATESKVLARRMEAHAEEVKLDNIMKLKEGAMDANPKALKANQIQQRELRRKQREIKEIIKHKRAV